MMDSDGFAKLPQDVIFQILQKLPTRALLQLRCAAKSFVPLISHPHLINLHLSSAVAQSHHLLYYESTDYTKTYFSFHVADDAFRPCKTLENPFESVNGYLRLVGCSRGVVCLFDTNYFTFVGTLILWNPFIGRFKILRRLDGFRDNLSHMAVGFGFDRRTADFKVVKIMYDDCDEHELLPKAYVYRVKIGCWRSVGPAVPCYMPKTWSSSVFVNGVVHWLSYKRPQFQGHPNCIMGFDLGKESFKVMELPGNLEPNFKDLRLSPLVDETSMALFVCNSINVGETWDVWLMSEYGVAESWVRIHSVVIDNQVLFPLRIVNSGVILAALSNEKLVLIDVEEEEVKEVQVNGLPLTFNTAGYSPSLALLDEREQLVA